MSLEALMKLSPEEQISLLRGIIKASVDALETDGVPVKEEMDWHVANGEDLECDRPDTYRILCLIIDIRNLQHMEEMHSKGKLEAIDTDEIPY